MIAEPSPYPLALNETEVQRHLRNAAEARVAELATWQSAGIVPGARVADIGCGPAAVSVELARLVAPGGAVDAVEQDATARAAAAQVVAAAGVDNVRVHAGDAAATGLAAGTYDVVMMRHVLVHNGGREGEIVAHLAGLLRPGGHLYLVEYDVTGARLVPEAPERGELRARWHELLRRRGGDPAIGTRLGHLVLEAGLELVRFDARYRTASGPEARQNRPAAVSAGDSLVQAGLATADDLRRWEAAWERQRTDPRPYFVFTPVFSAVGRRA